MDLIRRCRACAFTSAGSSKNLERKRLREDQPETYWEVDFTEVRPAHYENKYLLVFIDTFSGWVEAFPSKKETANVVTRKILEEILPRFGVPKVIRCPGKSGTGQTTGRSNRNYIVLIDPRAQDR